jgi:hypothetical protein
MTRFDPPAYSGWQAPVGTQSTETVDGSAPSGAADSTRADTRLAGLIVLVLIALGALLGLLWEVWSGPQQRAYVIGPGKLYPFDEVETMAAADGRYLVIVAATGLVAALLAWAVRAGNRGPLVLLALCVGGFVGAILTAWIGHLVGGGSLHGKTGTTIAHLPLSLHMRGLVFVEPAVAALVYGLFVAFAARDDLGREDPIRARVSVRAGDDAQDGGGYGDAAGALQQRDLPSQ